RVADQVVVDRVFTKHPFLTQVAELGVADRTVRVFVIHGVAAHPGAVGRLHDDVAAQVSYLATVSAFRGVVEGQRSVQGHFRPVDGLDGPLFRLPAVAERRAEGLLDFVLPRSGGDDDAVPPPPSRDRFGQYHRPVTNLRRRAQLDPSMA